MDPGSPLRFVRGDEFGVVCMASAILAQSQSNCRQGAFGWIASLAMTRLLELSGFTGLTGVAI
jgi:hypothetical protein